MASFPIESENGPAKDFWRVVLISDTHYKYSGEMINIPEGDILIHAGDFSNTGHIEEIAKFREFLETQPHPYKVFIAGNHDITIDKPFYISPQGHPRFHRNHYQRGGKLFHVMTAEQYSEKCISLLRYGSESYQQRETAGSVVQYLQDESYIVPPKLDNGSSVGLHIYGSPWQPTFCNWAFNVEIPDIKPHWDKIPDDVDLLITHGPPRGILDGNIDDFACGCPELKAQLETSRIRPRVHVFGHIHEAYGNTILFSDAV